jgi:hypothetical protein
MTILLVGGQRTVYADAMIADRYQRVASIATAKMGHPSIWPIGNYARKDL